ncbi:DUF2273 domain-containing protein [Enterococcus faecalis]
MKEKPLLRPYQNQFTFTLLFLLVAILFLTLGFWKTMLLLLFAAIGYLIGTMKDEQRSFFSIIASLQAYIEK